MRRKVISLILVVVFFLSFTAQNTQASFNFRTNSGGLAYTDTSGNSWSADNSFTGGSAFLSNIGSAPTGTSDPTLYQDSRFSATNFSYDVAVPNGSYTVTLKFAEIRAASCSTGARKFNVSIEGTQVLSSFDIFALAGCNNAVDKTFTTSVTDGTLNIVFTAVTGTAAVNAIQIVSASTPTATPTTAPTATPTVAPTPTSTPTPLPSPTSTPQATLNVPQKTCHPTSGVSTDLCNSGYAKPNNTMLSVTNAGITQPQNIFFTLTDLNTGLSGSGQGSPLSSTTINQLVTRDANLTLSLVDGHTFRWTTQAFDSFGNSSLADTSPWVFIYDATLPTYASSPTFQKCYTSSTLPTFFDVYPSDPVPNGIGNIASGVSQVWVIFDSQPETQVLYNGAVGAYRYTFPVLTPGVHRFFIKVIDNAGNLSGPLPTGYKANPDISFNLSATSCVAPWLQTSQGDVFSNTRIIAPGGP
jgi:hypothetical protein